MIARMLSQAEIKDLVYTYGQQVNEGRTIKKIIQDGDLPRLKGCTILQGKVSDSVFGENLISKTGTPIRLMYRGNRISTHDENRGEIPFKDQVLAYNHAHMLGLVKDVLGNSQFEIPNLDSSSTIIPSENLTMVGLENVLRMFMAQSSTSTSLYQHWLKKAV